jgi:hypothetical protein
MQAGIYVLRFKSGHYYIGKSDNVINRWQQHWKDFQKGTHSKKMQWCFNTYGIPTAELFLDCHKDHVDMYESIIIRMNLGELCLNTAVPKELPKEDVDTLMSSGQWVTLSTAEHFRMLHKLADEVKDKDITITALSSRLDGLELEGTMMPEEIKELVEYQNIEIASLQEVLDKQKTSLDQLQNRNWIERLLNKDMK